MHLLPVALLALAPSTAFAGSFVSIEAPFFILLLLEVTKQQVAAFIYKTKDSK